MILGFLTELRMSSVARPLLTLRRLHDGCQYSELIRQPRPRANEGVGALDRRQDLQASLLGKPVRMCKNKPLSKTRGCYTQPQIERHACSKNSRASALSKSCSCCMLLFRTDMVSSACAGSEECGEGHANIASVTNFA